MRQRMKEMTELVHHNLKTAQKRQKQQYDRGTRARSLNEGDPVLVLLPNPHDSLKLEWAGPHKAIHQISPVDYEVKMVRHK